MTQLSPCTDLPTSAATPTVIGKTTGPHRLAADVILVIQDDVGRLLGLNRGQFYGLDAIGTKMLLLLLYQGFNKTVESLVQEYAVNSEQIRADVTRFVEDLKRRHLLILWEPSSAVAPPGRLQIALWLTLAWFSIRLLGWTQTIRLWQRGHRSSQSDEITNGWDMTLQRLDRSIQEVAASFLLLPMACKERALVGWHLIRAYGLPAELVVGIDFYPFGAHAWVECGSSVLTDNRLHCETYVPAVRYR